MERRLLLLGLFVLVLRSTNAERSYRVVLLGKTGNGKSSTGNSILGDNIFKAKKSSNSVTSVCEAGKRELKDGRIFEVCDTPGLFCHGEDPIEMALKIQKSVDLCPNPHAFLLVFSGNRMTTDEKYTIDLLRIIFGDKMFDHCIVVITGGNDFESSLHFKEFWTENDEMKNIVERCDNRVVKIENAKLSPEKSELGALLEMIEQMASKGSYDYNLLKTHTQVLQEYKQTYGVSNSEDIDRHLHEVLNTLEKRLEEDRKIMEEKLRKSEEERKILDISNRILFALLAHNLHADLNWDVTKGDLSAISDISKYVANVAKDAIKFIGL